MHIYQVVGVQISKEIISYKVLSALIYINLRLLYVGAPTQRIRMKEDYSEEVISDVGTKL